LVGRSSPDDLASIAEDLVPVVLIAVVWCYAAEPWSIALVRVRVALESDDKNIESYVGKVDAFLGIVR